MNIKSLPESERPIEKMMYSGASSLSNAELWALIIRTGTSEKSAVQLAEDVISYSNMEIGSLRMAEASELKAIDGIGNTKACAIVACLELAKRYNSSFDNIKKRRVDTVERAAEAIMADLKDEKREHVISMMLNAKCEIEAKSTISIGELTNSSMHPREVFSPAIKRGAAAIIIAHNHPSGDPTPSDQDISVTNRIAKAGEIIGIKLYDHIIVGAGNNVSMREMGFID